MQIWLSWKRPWLLICSLKIGYSNSLRSQILQINFSAGNTTTRRTRQEETPYSQLNILPHQPPWLLFPLPFFSSIFPSQLLTPVSSLKYGPPSHGWTPLTRSSLPLLLLHFHLICNSLLLLFFIPHNESSEPHPAAKALSKGKSIKVISVFVVFHFGSRCFSGLNPAPSPICSQSERKGVSWSANLQSNASSGVRV